MRSITFLRKLDINYRKINERIKEPAGSKSYGKEDTVKETQEGCLSRPIRIKSELFESSDFQADWQKYFFDSLNKRFSLAAHANQCYIHYTKRKGYGRHGL